MVPGVFARIPHPPPSGAPSPRERAGGYAVKIYIKNHAGGDACDFLTWRK